MFGRNKNLSGQTMLLIVIVLGGTILGATIIAGILTVYQLHQNVDLSNSAKAIFGADTGIEWGLYQRFNPAEHPKPTLTNNVSFGVSCYDNRENKIDCSNASTTDIIATSTSGTSIRALEYSF